MRGHHVHKPCRVGVREDVRPDARNLRRPHPVVLRRGTRIPPKRLGLRRHPGGLLEPRVPDLIGILDINFLRGIEVFRYIAGEVANVGVVRPVRQGEPAIGADLVQ